MHFHEHIRNGPVAAFVHGEALPVPVAGRTHLLKLGNNTPAILFFPFPGPLQKFLPPQVMLVDALFLQLFDNLHFRGDGGMVRARLPQGIITLHPLKTDKNILHGVVQRMSHMQLSGDIRGRDHDGEGCPAMVHLRVKIFFLHPLLIQSVLYALGVIGLGQLSAHSFSPL